jgi:RNA polymerase sigma-70 factor (ECF subfamily)
VDASVKSDASAFAALYDQHVERIYRHCYYQAGNRAEAEDLTQQSFLQAWQAIRYRRGATPFLA